MSGRSKLILVEGLCGTGKTTLAERLHRDLENRGIPSRFYDEGAGDHPASLNGYAFYREADYANLLARYPDLAEAINARAIRDGLGYIIPYRWAGAHRELNILYNELRSRELCWTDTPIATLSEFTSLIQRHWARFAERAGSSDDLYVMEAVLMQHQIHDLSRHYEADDEVIRRHIAGIAERIAALNPVLIYLSQPSVREQQVWISSVRSKPRFASEPNIRFMENRKRIELKLLNELPFPAYRIENANRDWETVYARAAAIVDRYLG